MSNDSMKENDNNKEDLSIYFDVVNNLARTHSFAQFTNSSPKHAAIVLNVMLSRSKDDAYMIVGELTNDAAKDELFISGINSYLSTNHTLSILTDKEFNEESFRIENKSLYDIFIKNKAKLNIKKSNHTFQKHFFVSGNMYRFEQDPSNMTAVCCFNDKDSCLKLITTFKQYYTDAIPLPL